MGGARRPVVHQAVSVHPDPQSLEVESDELGELGELMAGAA
ncbi:hypothetical protein OG594_36875 [Streptomyces sp. NBC_01214]|nr:hypothetical protein [Streptomyces sp. NBC_01214]MCX4807128.1 hypothetical protein [Streptomyces sp. NBC_01214]